MSKNVEYQLPGALPGPSDSVTYIPLGGDGWSAPQSAYSVYLKHQGDSSGDEFSLEVAFDPQYTSLVQYMSFNAQYGAAVNDFAVRTALRVTKRDEVVQKTWQYSEASLDQSVVPQFGYNDVWEPPGLMLSSNSNAGFDLNPRIALVANNDPACNLTLSLRVLNFQKRAREEVPLNVLLSSLPR